jgi:hypothetical protein
MAVLFHASARDFRSTCRREDDRRTRDCSAKHLRLFHNHTLIEPLLQVFDYGTPPFDRLLSRWRAGVVEEAAMSGTDLLLSFVWDLQQQADTNELARYIRFHTDEGADVAFVELSADLNTRLRRNRTELRLAEKRSKRDVKWSDANVREMERFRMNTNPKVIVDPVLPGTALLAEHRHMRLDNGDLTPQEAAARVLAWLDEGPTGHVSQESAS